MRKFRNLLALGMVVIMSVCLVACGNNDSDDDDDDDDKSSKEKGVTVESILEDISTDDMSNYTADVLLDFDINIDTKSLMMDMYDYTEEDIEAAIESGETSEEYLDMNIAFGADLTMAYTGEYSYIKGSMNIAFADTEESVDIETYSDMTDKDTVITYSYEDGDWYVSEEDAEESATAAMDIAELTKYIKDSELEEKDDVYSIDATIDFAKLCKDQAELIESAVDESDSENEDITMALLDEIDVLDVVIEIDKETNTISKFSYDMSDIVTTLLKVYSDEAELDVDLSKYVTVNKLLMEMELDKYGKTEVEIPEDVIDEAISYDDEDYYWDDEDDYSDDWDDDYSDELVYDGDRIVISNYNDEVAAYVTVPDGCYVETDYCSPSYVAISDTNWKSFYVYGYISMNWVEDMLNGEALEYEDLDDCTRNEYLELESIETNQGTVRVFVNIWSFDEDYENDYYSDYTLVLNADSETPASIEIMLHCDDDFAYTIEELAQTVFQ